MTQRICSLIKSCYFTLDLGTIKVANDFIEVDLLVHSLVCLLTVIMECCWGLSMVLTSQMVHFLHVGLSAHPQWFLHPQYPLLRLQCPHSVFAHYNFAQCFGVYVLNQFFPDLSWVVIVDVPIVHHCSLYSLWGPRWIDCWYWSILSSL